MIEMVDVSVPLQELFGTNSKLDSVRSVSGGDINEAYLLILSDGKRIFLKENTQRNTRFFEAEQAGIAAIKATGTISVPHVLKTGIASGRSYLMMEYLEAAPKQSDYWEHFGRQLAAMHRADPSKWTRGGKYGFSEDNYIGAGEQFNAVAGSWVSFFRECRLEVQFSQAQKYFDPEDRKFMQRLLDHLDEYLIEPEYPSLLHGDLWSGNFVTGPDGYAWLIDPAVYVGHAEAALSMTELFGGFAPDFYDAYREAGTVLPGYADRRELYNLYHLLNHLNLFGGSYYGAVKRTLRRFTG